MAQLSGSDGQPPGGPGQISEIEDIAFSKRTDRDNLRRHPGEEIRLRSTQLSRELA